MGNAKDGASARIRRQERMSKASIAIIQERVNEELKSGSTIDVYHLAEALHQHCPDLGVEEVARHIGEAVVHSRGSAVWVPK